MFSRRFFLKSSGAFAGVPLLGSPWQGVAGSGGAVRKRNAIHVPLAYRIKSASWEIPKSDVYRIFYTGATTLTPSGGFSTSSELAHEFAVDLNLADDLYEDYYPPPEPWNFIPARIFQGNQIYGPVPGTDFQAGFEGHLEMHQVSSSKSPRIGIVTSVPLSQLDGLAAILTAQSLRERGDLVVTVVAIPDQDADREFLGTSPLFLDRLGQLSDLLIEVPKHQIEELGCDYDPDESECLNMCGAVSHVAGEVTRFGGNGSINTYSIGVRKFADFRSSNTTIGTDICDIHAAVGGAGRGIFEEFNFDSNVSIDELVLTITQRLQKRISELFQAQGIMALLNVRQSSWNLGQFDELLFGLNKHLSPEPWKLLDVIFNNHSWPWTPDENITLSLFLTGDDLNERT